MTTKDYIRTLPKALRVDCSSEVRKVLSAAEIDYRKLIELRERQALEARIEALSKSANAAPGGAK